MLEMLEKLVFEIIQNRGKVIGLFAGLIFGILVINIGFLKTLFITLCLFLGYIIGKRVDDNESIREVVERMLKDRS